MPYQVWIIRKKIPAVIKAGRIWIFLQFVDQNVSGRDRLTVVSAGIV